MEQIRIVRFIWVLLAVLLITGCVSDSKSVGPQFRGMAPDIWQGRVDANGIISFKGVPFARPPVGDLRWQPPESYQPKGGTHQADSYAPACMQGPHTVNWYQNLIESLNEDRSLFAHPEKGYSEDCLYLNIWTPSEALLADDKRAVMVWIHGGSNKGGWPYEPDYRGEQLAGEGVVVVSIPYRLGVYGFFSHPDLVKEQAGVAGNYGLLDLIAALQWVSTHIADFGGDPDNITVFGESSGAANIGYLMSSPTAAGLFHRAIHQSAGFEMQRNRSLEELNELGEQLQLAVGAADIRSMRALTSAQLLAAVDEHLPDMGFGPVEGGHALPQSPGKVFRAGQQAMVPLMIGTNTNEWRMYLDAAMSFNNYLEEVGLVGEREGVEALFKGLSELEKKDRLTTAQQMLCPSYEMAELMKKAAQNAYVYQLSRVRDGEHWQSVGAYHGAEIPYVFNTHADWLTTNEADDNLTEVIQKYWIEFAQTGIPGADWPGFTELNLQVMLLDVPHKMVTAPDADLCELLYR